METTSILLYGTVALVVVIVLGIMFSKRNASKKDKSKHVVEVPEKEYSQYNEEEADEYEADLMFGDEECVKCHLCGAESTDNFNDKPVCDSCFEKLDDDWASEPKTPLRVDSDKESSEEYNNDYSSGPSLTDFVLGFVVLVITLTIGISVLSSLSDAFDSGAMNSTTMNSTTSAIESFSVLGDWFAIIFIVGVAAVILGTMFQIFNWTRVGDL